MGSGVMKRGGSSRLGLFHFVFRIMRKWSRFRNEFYRFIIFHPDFRKRLKNFDLDKELCSVIPIIRDYKASISSDERNKIISEAEQVLESKFTVFNKNGIELNPIPWHRDLNSGFEWERGKFYKDYIQTDLKNNADVKFPRELSRSHFLLYLGEAYLLTRDERFSQQLIRIITDWIDENPFLFSINWCCTMDVAIRGINQAYAVRMVADSIHLTLSFKKKFILSMYQHAWYIYKNQEWNYYNNANHYDSNIAALLFFGLLFMKTGDGKKWYMHAMEEFFFEVRQQILPSGVIYEKSTNYGRLVIEMFTFCYCLLENQKVNVPNDISYRIEKQMEFVLNYTKQDGLAPVIGDLDDARWLPFYPLDRSDHRHLLSLGAALFKRGDLKKYSRGYTSDVFFLVPGSDAREYDSIRVTDTTLRSISFKDAGYFIIRTKDIYMFINNAGISKYQDDFEKRYFASHTHADLLSFELAFKNRTYLIDPGSFVYTSNAEERNLFRSTGMHNTVRVDKTDQLEIKEDKLFGYYSNIYPLLIDWKSNSYEDIFIGEHNGYERLPDPVIHRRKITINKSTQLIEIYDSLTGSETHEVELFFHFNTGIDFEHVSDNIIKTYFPDESNLYLEFNCIYSFSMKKQDSWVSKKYGQKERSKTLKIQLVKVQFPVEFKTGISFK